MRKMLIGLTVVLTSSLSIVTHAEPFGTTDDQIFGKKLWNSLARAGLVGENRIMSRPYEGTHPHGAVLDTMETTLRIEGHEGPVIVKHNYGGEGVSIDSVANDPSGFLGAITVMYQRKDGYDEDNNNWFWAKYKPDGSFDTNPKDMKLVGKVAKGMSSGCIACHSGAPGEDLVFINDRY